MQPLVKEQSDLSNAEIQRYSRHLIMPEVGIEGQRKLKAASVTNVFWNMEFRRVKLIDTLSPFTSIVWLDRNICFVAAERPCGLNSHRFETLSRHPLNNATNKR